MPSVYKDLFLTPRYFIKGNVFPLHGRLSSFLDRHTRRFLQLRDARLLDLESREELEAGAMLLHTDEILFAHELIESGGDLYRKHKVPDVELEPVRLVLRGPEPIELSGLARPAALASTMVSHRFLVLQQPRMENLPDALERELDLLGSLGYLIVNKDQVGYVFAT